MGSVSKTCESAVYGFSADSSVTPVGKHLLCACGQGIIIIPDFAGPLENREERAPILVDLNGATFQDYATCQDHLIVYGLTAFYIIDTAQFDNAEPPAELRATVVSRFEVVLERGVFIRVTVSPGAIHEVLHVDHSQWDENGDGVEKESPNEEQIDHCTRRLLTPVVADCSRSHLQLRIWGGIVFISVGDIRQTSKAT